MTSNTIDYILASNIESTSNSYEDLYLMIISLEKTKNKEIKEMMNSLVNNSDSEYKKKYDELPIYLDYIIKMLSTSYPFINKYINDIIKIILIVDNYDIHPLIFQSLFTNLIHSISLNELINFSNNNIINYLHSVQNEIEILFSSYNTIFENIDNKYLEAEKKIGYNNILNLNYDQFTSLFNSITINPYSNHNKQTIINTLLIQIENMNHHDIENYIKSIKINFDELLVSNNKLAFDTNLLNELTQNYIRAIDKNYKQIQFFDIFNDFDISKQLKINSKNILYFWIDYIAIINNSLFEKLLKK
jgi:hypothetical protein